MIWSRVVRDVQRNAIQGRRWRFAQKIGQAIWKCQVSLWYRLTIISKPWILPNVQGIHSHQRCCEKPSWGSWWHQGLLVKETIDYMIEPITYCLSLSVPSAVVPHGLQVVCLDGGTSFWPACSQHAVCIELRDEDFSGVIHTRIPIPDANNVLMNW